jgi:hypothetical protein
MSDREKKLILFFALAGFAILNFLAFNFAQSKRQQVNRDQIQAKQKLQIAEQFQESRQQVLDQMEWLTQHEPQPQASQEVQTALQQLVEREAKAAGLTIKTQKILPTDEPPEKHYHRAQFQITVTGIDEAIYRWFDKLNIPDQLRIASQIRLVPNNPDDTKLDCTATVAQWFVPLAL